jgi:hypothetical protein
MKIMRFINLSKIAGNSALILGLVVATILSVHAQNSNTGNLTNRTLNSNTGSSSSQMANSNSVTTNTTRVEATSTPRSEATATPRPQATSTPRTEVQTVVEKENNFPWGLLGLLGLAGLIPKKRSVEVTGVRETSHQTRTTPDNRDNKPNQ